MKFLRQIQINDPIGESRFRWLLIGTLAFLSICAWAFASPIGAPPDGDFHMASIWCAQGDRLGMCKLEKVKDSSQVELLTPRTFSRYQNPYGHFCYVGNPGASAGCTNVVDETSVTELVASGRVVSGDPGSNIFYDLTSRLASRDTESSAFRIRFANVLFFVGAASLLLLVFKRFRTVTALAFLVGLGPWGSFLISSIHPSSWTITLLPLFLVALLAALKEKANTHRVYAALVALLIWFITQDIRSDSRYFLIIALVTAVAWSVNFRREIIARPNWQKVIGLLMFGAVFFRIIRPLVQEINVAIGEVQTDKVFNLTTTKVPLTLMNLFGGNYGLGSSDTPLSDLVVFCGIVSLFLVIYSTAQRVSRRNWLVVFLMSTLLILLPLRAELGFIGTGGRYILPLYLMCLITYLASVETSAERPLITSKTVSRILICFLTLGNSIALHQTMRRYITGVDIIGWNLNQDAEWWWTVGPSPMTIWLLGTAAFGVTATLILQNARSQVNQ